MSVRGRWLVAVLAGIVVIAGAALLLWPNQQPVDTTVSIGTSNCGAGWTASHPGEQTLQLHNTGSATAEVELVEVHTGEVFGEVDGLAAGGSRPLRVVLGGGDFAVRCGVEDTDPITGPTVHIDGPAVKGVVPVTANDLAGPLKAYQAYVVSGLAELVTHADQLRDAVHANDVTAARSQWTQVHSTYVRLGAAYGAFGDADAKITDGFQQLEQGLWKDPAGLTPVADKLDADVHDLQTAFPSTRTDPKDLGLRAHEVLEDSIKDTLTGKDDHGSGTGIATLSAALDGTSELITVLRPVLTGRYPALSEVDSGLAKVRALIAADGATSLDALSRTQREQLNGAVGDLVEKLAPIAVICEPRRTG